MINTYSIVIPNTKATSYKVVTLLILIINLLVFGYLFFAVSKTTSRSLQLSGFFINTFAIAGLIAVKYIKVLQSIRAYIIFIVNAVIWLVMGKYLIAVLLFVFAIAAVFANKKLILVFNQKGILYPSFPVKLFLWKDLTQVMLKDDILTIDLKNNQLLQFNLDSEVAAEIDEEGFNEYCGERLGEE